jgi:hypothetical protein
MLKNNSKRKACHPAIRQLCYIDEAVEGKTIHPQKSYFAKKFTAHIKSPGCSALLH